MTQPPVYPSASARIAERRKQLAPDIHAAFQEFSRHVFAGGALDERYLVAMLGDGVNSVANVRAAGGEAVLCHWRREAVHLEEVDAGARAPILQRYLQLAPGARAHIPWIHGPGWRTSSGSPRSTPSSGWGPLASHDPLTTRRCAGRPEVTWQRSRWLPISVP